MLTCGAAPVALHSRAFDILALLIACRDRVLTRDAIAASVWKGLVVAPNNVTVQISTLRRTLEDNGGAGLIITVPGSGYRFVGDLHVLQPPAPTPATAAPLIQQSGATRHIWAGMGAAALGFGAVAALLATKPASPPGPPRLSIAVLPFQNLTDGSGGGYMADVVTEDLTADLAVIPQTVVVPHEDAARLRDQSDDVRAVGKALHVRYLVRGSLRFADHAYHANAQLIDTQTGTQPWAMHFDTQADSLTDAQTTIVRQIASALDTALTDRESAAGQHERPNRPNAEDLFFHARSISLHDDSLAGYTTAQALLEAAIRQRPDFTDALAQLSLILVLKLQTPNDPTLDADLAEARAMIARAPDHAHNPVTLSADARLLEFTGDCSGAIQSARDVLDLEPNNLDALAVLAKCAVGSGQLDAAAGYIQTLLRLNPDPIRNKPRLQLLGQIDLFRGHFADAIADTSRALVGDDTPQPGAASMGRAEYTRLLRLAATASSGDTSGARALFAAYDAIWPHRSVWRVAALSPKSVAVLPGFRNFTSGLLEAGMPPFADESAPGPPGLQPGADDFAPTPNHLPGATTLTTPQMSALVAHAAAPVLDLGQGAAAIDSAVLLGSFGVTTAEIDAAAAAATKGNKSMRIVVMADGTYGNAAPLAVLHLQAQGYTAIDWYRGGEEAWVAAGLPSSDRRTQF